MKKMVVFPLAVALTAWLLPSMAVTAVLGAANAGEKPAGAPKPGGVNEAAQPVKPEKPVVRVGTADQDGVRDGESGDNSGEAARLPDEAGKKWDSMMQDEKRKFMQEHPGLNREMFNKEWDQLTLGERESFIAADPELKGKQERFLGAEEPAGQEPAPVTGAVTGDQPAAPRDTDKKTRAEKPAGGAFADQGGNPARDPAAGRSSAGQGGNSGDGSIPAGGRQKAGKSGTPEEGGK